jgi:Tfp pilus assembly protein PilO
MATSSKSLLVRWQQHLARNFRWWAVAVAVVVLGVGTWLFILPLYRDIKENNEAVVLEQRLQQAQGRFEALQVKAQAWSQKSQDDAISLILPSSTDLPNLLTELEALAIHSKLQIQGISLTPEGGAANARFGSLGTGITDSGIKQLKVNITVSGGTYQRLREFLRLTKSAWRLVALKSLTFGRDGNYAVELTSYYYTH